MSKLKDPNYRIRQFRIKFIAKNGLYEEYHLTTFNKEKGLPFCSDPKNLKETIRDQLDKAMTANDRKRQAVLEIITNKGTFIYKKV